MSRAEFTGEAAAAAEKVQVEKEEKDALRRKKKLKKKQAQDKLKLSFGDDEEPGSREGDNGKKDRHSASSITESPGRSAGSKRKAHPDDEA